MADPTYVFRAFIDPGANLLWSANDAARERFDYPVELEELPISAQLVAEIGRLFDRFEASIPLRGEQRPFSEEEWRAFRTAYLDMLDRLRAELGPDYEIRDEEFSDPRT